MTADFSPQDAARSRLALLFSLAAVSALSACGGGDDAPAPAPAPPAPVALTCDDSMKTAFKPDANTTVLLVKSFKAGDPIALSGTTGTPPVAAKDLCFVKLNVGPGNPGPASAPSTSPGIGIEAWLPTPANYAERIHNIGGGGWAGGANYQSTTLIATTGNAATAASENAVVGSTDTGHAVGNGSFAMNPDGTINSTLWQDFSERSLHELAVKTKALAAAYYLKSQKFAYWDGCSTGGRQGYKIAQTHPDDYNGYLVGAPAFNWTKFITTELYPQIVNARDLGGVAPSTAQQNLVSGSAVSACDVVGGQHRGFIPDPQQCAYDPAKDASVLCTGQVGTNGVVGTNATAACVTTVQAQAFNKYWFGQTPDGSVPDPAANNGYNANLTDKQLWYGLSRGSSLGSLSGASPFTIASDMVALELQNSTIATPAFTNATGNGNNGYRNLTYGQLADAFAQGIALQPFFGNINTDSADLSGAQKAGAKLLQYHGSADVLIPVQGSVNYYTRVANLDGGFAKTQAYDRLFLVPGMGHCSGVGTAAGVAGPAVTAANFAQPASGQLYGVLRAWVEGGAASAPSSITVTSTDTTSSQLLCPYPQKATYNGTGAITAAASYTCK